MFGSNNSCWWWTTTSTGWTWTRRDASLGWRMMDRRMCTMECTTRSIEVSCPDWVCFCVDNACIRPSIMTMMMTHRAGLWSIGVYILARWNTSNIVILIQLVLHANQFKSSHTKTNGPLRWWWLIEREALSVCSCKSMGSFQDSDARNSRYSCPCPWVTWQMVYTHQRRLTARSAMQHCGSYEWTGWMGRKGGNHLGPLEWSPRAQCQVASIT